MPNDRILAAASIGKGKYGIGASVPTARPVEDNLPLQCWQACDTIGKKRHGGAMRRLAKLGGIVMGGGSSAAEQKWWHNSWVGG